MVDYPSGVADPTPTILVGVDTNVSMPAFAPVGPVGLAVMAAATQGAAQAALGIMAGPTGPTGPTGAASTVKSPSTLTDAATIAVDASLSDNFSVLLTSAIGATRILGAPTNLIAGMSFVIEIIQPATGNCAMTYNAIYKFPGASPPALSATDNAIDFLTGYYDGARILASLSSAYG